MAFKRAQITVSPILYVKDTNLDYVLDTNDEKIILNDNIQEISSSSEYDVIVTIQEY